MLRNVLAWILAPLFALALASPASAAFITPNEAEMESLFADNGLDLDIRFNPAEEIARADLLTLDSEEDAQELLALAPATSPTVNMAFIDSISWCGGTVSSSFIGCGVVDGNGIAVESEAAAEETGGILNAHELGHNYGLTHVDDGGNLMDSTISLSNTELTSSQIDTVGASELVQSDSAGLFTAITPILVVPEPASGLLLALGLGALAGRPRRPRRPGPASGPRRPGPGPPGAGGGLARGRGPAPDGGGPRRAARR